MLHLLGCQLPKQVMGGGVGNELGHWESAPIASFNEEVLASAGSSWDDWLPFNPDWYQSPVVHDFVERGRAWLTEEFGSSPLFVLKDPRICRIANFWLDIFAAEGIEPAVVVPVRNPLEVGNSLNDRDMMEPGYAHLLWLRHILDAEIASRGLKRVFCTYDQLLEDWPGLADRMKVALGITWPRISASAAAEISSFLTTKQRHYSNSQKLTGFPISEWISKTYAVALRWSVSSETEADFRVLDSIRAELDAASPAFAHLLLPRSRSGMAGDGSRRRAELEAQLSDAEARLNAAEARWQNARQDYENGFVQQLNHLIEEIADSQREIERLANNERILGERLAQSEASLDERTAQLEATASRLDELAVERDTMGHRLADVESTLRQREEEVAQSEVSLGEKTAQFEAAVSRLDELAIERDTMGHRLADVESTLRQREEEVAQVWAELSTEREAKAVLQGEFSELERDHVEQLRALSRDRELVEQKLAEINSENEAATRAWEQRLAQEQASRETERARADNMCTALEGERSNHVATARNLALAQSDLAATQGQLHAMIGRVGQLARGARSNKWLRKLLKMPVLRKYNRRLQRNVDQILAFLAQFTDAELGMPSAGREDRVLAYMLGMTSSIADMPLLDRNAYRALHPDVAKSKIDPFIHYLEFGQPEGRSPHPLLNYDYYTQRYPETARYGHSVLEHYLRFGAAKGYDPCELFSTSDYLARYPDVQHSKYNALIHYLRHPGCQPHPSFDSNFYLTQYPDIARAGVNPLVHFLLWGRAEGRQPTPNHAAGSGHEVPRIASGTALLAKPAAHVTPVGPRPVLPTVSRPPLVVMVEAFYPRPDRDSGSLDQVNFVKIFQLLGYEVAFAALLDCTPDADAKRPLVDLGAKCITASDYINVEEFVFLNAERISAFFLSRFNYGGSWIEKARTFCPHAQVIFNTVDLHHVREERRALIENDDAALEIAKVTKEGELARIAAADVTIVVSESERDLLETLSPTADVRVIPLIREVRERSFPPFEDRDGIAFVGGFQHQPNIDAVTTFLDTIWPKVLAAAPTMKFRVIGSHLPDSLSQRQDRNVEWIGYVPELEPWLDKVRLTVAPLRFGAGAKGKVVSSLLSAVPVVASQIAAEGMGIAEGDGIVTADGPEDYAARVLALHDDKELWNQASTRGFDAVRKASSLERGVELVGQILPRLVAA